MDEFEKLIKELREEADAISILLDRERQSKADDVGNLQAYIVKLEEVLNQILWADEAGESIPKDILDATKAIMTMHTPKEK